MRIRWEVGLCCGGVDDRTKDMIDELKVESLRREGVGEKDRRGERENQEESQ